MKLCCTFFLFYVILTLIVGMMMYIKKKPEDIIENTINFVDTFTDKPIKEKYSHRPKEKSAFE